MNKMNCIRYIFNFLKIPQVRPLHHQNYLLQLHVITPPDAITQPQKYG